jgi:hypothetical protein
MHVFTSRGLQVKEAQVASTFFSLLGSAVFRGLLVLGLLSGAVGLLSGCSDSAKEEGTQAEFDLAKQKEGMKRMEDYMKRKAKGEIPGIPKK